MKCDFFSLSDRGLVRPNNEDAVAVDAALGLAVLADGMGGYNAGEVASALSIEHVLQTLRPELSSGTLHASRHIRRWLQEGMTAANRAVFQAAQGNDAWRGMGTTLVVAVFQGQKLVVGHIGDSRVYRFRQGQLVLLTRDHSLLQEQIDAGLIAPEMARAVQYKNLVTRAIGVAPVVAADIAEHVIEPGDTYLICSDGLNDMLTDSHMAQVLRREKSLATAGEVLLREANSAGGRDNISLVLVQCSPDPATPGLLSRLMTL